MDKLSERWMFYCGLLAGMGVGVDDLKHIQNLIDAEEQGLLLRLPCKVGDTVWSIEMCNENGRIEEFTVTSFNFSDGRIYAKQGYVFIGEVGFTVFATKEEAEQKLAEIRGE